MKTKVAITGNSSWNVLNFRLGLIKKLMSEGYEVHIIAPEDEYTSELLDETGAYFHDLENFSRGKASYFREFQLIRELRRLYKENDINLAINFAGKPAIYGNFAKRGLDIKTVMNITGLGYLFINRSLGNRLLQNLYRWSSKRADLVCFQNSTDRKLFIDRNFVEPDKTRLVRGSGVNMDKFSSQPKSSNGEIRFLFSGRYLRDKGIVEFFEAFGRLAEKYPNAKLDLVGKVDSGQPTSLTEQELQFYLEANDQITDHGYQPSVKPFIENADCCVLPSYREGLPMSLLEAMSMSRPIITTDTAGCNELVEEGKNGYLVPVEDSQGLYDAMEKFMQLSDSERQSMGAYSRSMIEQNFESNIITENFMEIINELDG